MAHSNIVIQSRPSLTITPNATHLRYLPLRGISPKASRFSWRQPLQDVAGRLARLGPCFASRPNVICFESLEPPCQIRCSYYIQIIRMSLRLLQFLAQKWGLGTTVEALDGACRDPIDSIMHCLHFGGVGESTMEIRRGQLIESTLRSRD